MIKKIILCLSALLVLFAAFVGYRMQQYSKEYSAGVKLNAPIEIPDVGIISLNELTDSEKPAVVMFYADWCTFCRRFMPEYGKIAKKYSDKYNFTVVNCDYPENAETVKKYHIVGLPSLFIVDNKLNFNLQLNTASVADNSVFKEEIEKYSDFRTGILSKIAH